MAPEGSEEVFRREHAVTIGRRAEPGGKPGGDLGGYMLHMTSDIGCGDRLDDLLSWHHASPRTAEGGKRLTGRGALSRAEQRAILRAKR